MRLKLLLATVLSGLLLVSPLLKADTVEVPIVEDLYQLGQLSHERKLPILLMFSMEFCPYCDLLVDDFLRPMLISGDYEERVLIRMFKIDEHGKVRDFDGKRRDVYDIQSRYNVSVTPTMVFIDGNGKQLARRMVGVSTPDFFGGYIDDNIDTALKRLRNTQSTAQPDL